MKTEQDYTQALPFLADFDPVVRAQFIEAMEALQSTPLFSPPDKCIGVIILADDGIDCRIISRECCAERAAEAGLPSCAIDAIRSQVLPGHFDVLVLAGPVQMVIGIPVEIQRIPRPGSENN